MANLSTAALHGETALDGKLSIPFRKQADSFRLRREAEAMNYVRSHTSIPVPSIFDTHFGISVHDPGWIFDGTSPRTTVGRSMADNLHRPRPPGPGWIGSCSGGPAYDHRLDNRATCGPFASVAEFHDFLVSPVKNCPRPEWVAKYRNMLPDNYHVTFAHAHLSWENVLLDPTTGSVTGIVDWEMAGFWPEWWEYRKALFGSRPRQWWIEIVKQIMQEYQPETEADMELEMF